MAWYLRGYVYATLEGGCSHFLHILTRVVRALCVSLAALRCVASKKFRNSPAAMCLNSAKKSVDVFRAVASKQAKPVPFAPKTKPVLPTITWQQQSPPCFKTSGPQLLLELGWVEQTPPPLIVFLLFTEIMLDLLASAHRFQGPATMLQQRLFQKRNDGQNKRPQQRRLGN